MTNPARALLAEVGISVSGYDAAELDDALAAGVTHRTEPAPEPQPDTMSLEAEHRKQLVANAMARMHANRFRIHMAGARWRKRRSA